MNSVLKKIVTLSLVVSFYQAYAIEGEIKVRGAAFIPTSKLFRCIYGKAGGCFEIEGAVSLCDYGQLWANFDWFSKCGHSIGFCNPTHIQVPSFSIGLKGVYDVSDCTSLYLGLGPNFSKIRIKNKSLCGVDCCSKGAVGLVIKSGVDFDVCDCVFVDLFVDYLYQPVKFQCRENVGGVRIGAGLGTRF